MVSQALQPVEPLDDDDLPDDEADDDGLPEDEADDDDDDGWRGVAGEGKGGGGDNNDDDDVEDDDDEVALPVDSESP